MDTMNNLFLVTSRSVTSLVTRIIGSGLILILGIFLLFGCASSRNVVPISDGAEINSESQSATKTDEGVKVTAQGAAWERKLKNLEKYVTPFYITIQNDTATGLTFSYDDLALISEAQVQYNPLTPETVAQILRDSQNRYASGPAVSVGVGTGFGIGDDAFSFFNIFFPVWSASPPEKVEDVFAEALAPSVVQPKSTLQGFVYFKKVPKEVKRVTLKVNYNLQGNAERHELSFPFELK